MTSTNANLRKAAVLIRSLDADSAAALLAQLSPAEAARVREAMRAVGQIDPEERAEVAAEFRRIRPATNEAPGQGVELSLSSPDDQPGAQPKAGPLQNDSQSKRFDFLENAPTAVLVSHLSREHAQTIAVVLAHLAPGKAADVLAALPQKLRAETVERLSTLGEADSQTVAVLESELAGWTEKRRGGRAERGRRGDTISAILAAADAKTRRAIVDNLDTKTALSVDAPRETIRSEKPAEKASQELRNAPARAQLRTERRAAVPRPPLKRQPVPFVDFDHVVHFDDQTLAAVLRKVDADTLALALAGSGDELIERICSQMPKPTAKSFQREIRRLGPTRLSDVETAQRLVADVAAQQLAQRRSSSAANAR